MSDDGEELPHHMDQVLFATEECLEQGRFNYKTIVDRLDDIVEFGTTVKGFTPSEDDATTVVVLESLKEVLTSLSEQIEFHLEDLKEFREEDNPYTEIVDAAENLLKLLIESLSTPGQTNEDFKTAVEENSPASHGIKLLEALENDENNPLKTALEQDPDKNGEFMKWEGTISGFLAQFLYIETYSCGLIDDRSRDESNGLKEKIDEFFKQWYGEEEQEEEEENQEE